jgi:hypothetical protein
MSTNAQDCNSNHAVARHSACLAMLTHSSRVATEALLTESVVTANTPQQHTKRYVHSNCSACAHMLFYYSRMLAQ